jgi:hypothetical protein
MVVFNRPEWLIWARIRSVAALWGMSPMRVVPGRKTGSGERVHALTALCSRFKRRRRFKTPPRTASSSGRSSGCFQALSFQLFPSGKQP